MTRSTPTSFEVPRDLDHPVKRAPLVGVVYNPHSHHNKGRNSNPNTASNLGPSFDPDLGPDGADDPNILVAQPAGGDDLPQILADFAERGIDLLVINGGDGTVRDVLTSGLLVWGDNWPALAVLPTGKTNALNVELGAPKDWTLRQAVDAYSFGRRLQRRGVQVTATKGALEGKSLLGFILGAGAFTAGIKVGQDAHRLGVFNSLAVAGTSLWGVLQAVFGSDQNIWRRGAGLRLFVGQDAVELPHGGFGHPERRGLLFSSTLEKFPAGMKPFGPYRTGLKMVVMDKTRRRLLAMMPTMVLGFAPMWLQRIGLHFVQCEIYEMHIEDEFILDGEAFPPGHYTVAKGPQLCFVVP